MQHDFEGRLAVLFSRAVVMGITGNWAFAAGTVLLALRRHNPALNADIIVFCDGTLPAEDARILQGLGAQLVPFTPIDAALTAEALSVFSPLSLAKFHCFDLLRHYESVVWLDSDILVQDSLEELFAFGPLALALEDPEFSDPPGAKPAQINLHGPVQDFDGGANNLNSGIIVFRNDLPEPETLRQMCLDFVCTHGTLLRYPDQAAFNALVQILLRQAPHCVCSCCRNALTRTPVTLRPPLRLWCTPLGPISCGTTASRQPAFPNGSATTPAGCALAAAPTPGLWKMQTFWKAARFRCSPACVEPSRRRRRPLSRCNSAWRPRARFAPVWRLWSADWAECLQNFRQHFRQLAMQSQPTGPCDDRRGLLDGSKAYLDNL